MTHTDLTLCGGCGKYILGTIRMCPGCGWRPDTPDTAPSQSADLIAEAEDCRQTMVDGDQWRFARVTRDLITALRAAEERAEVLQSELTEFLDIGYSLERIANLSEKWSDSLVRQINEIARDALDRRSTDYADALRAAEAENARLREPDMFWDSEDPENAAESEDDLVSQIGSFAPTVMRVMSAVRMPDYWIAATCPEDDVEWVITRHKTREEAEAALAARRALGGEP